MSDTSSTDSTSQIAADSKSQSSASGGPPLRRDQKKDTVWSYVIAIAIALAIRWAFAEAYVIPSGSMLPTLLLHDHIFVNKFIYGIRIPFSKEWLVKFHKPEAGEVIVFKHPNDESTFLIKRIVAVAGDKLYFDGQRLYVNDKEVETVTPKSQWDWDWLRESDVEGAKDQHGFMTEMLGSHPHSVLFRKSEPSRGGGPLTVPPDSLFVMGDHRDNSADSRFWGFVPVENILGRAMFVWLTCDEPFPVINAVCDPRTIRWSRLGHWIQ
jgi:signal peptidase I